MSRTARYLLFAIGVGCVGVLFVLAALHMPHFGTSVHTYRDHAVTGAVKHATPNVISAINYDQRALDTLVEETILLGSVIGAAVLLRPSREEHERRDPGASDQGRTLEATRLTGYVLLPVTLVIGLDLVVHGHLTPGGGFQGGVVLATGLHLLYIAGQYRALERLRPTVIFEVGEAIGEAAFVCIGLAAMVVSGAFLANFINQGTFGNLVSSGTVPLLSIAIGIEVASGVVIVLSAFLDQALAIGPEPDRVRHG